ncbi:MAG: phage integrase SAM-like domain-containing protein [Limnohabitans sp.]|nr:phage integrase SAM-like domain-containing protein [Limnohabitans sp.]
MTNSIDLRALFSLYARYKLLRPATIRSYEDAIRNVERFNIESTAEATVPLEHLTLDMLLSHRAWCLQYIRPTSYNKHRRHLRALVNFAVSENMLNNQPFNKVGPAPTGARRPKTIAANWYKKAMTLLDDGQVQGLNPTRFWRLLFSVMHFTSMRRRQIVELRWEHVLLSRSALLMASSGSKSMREWVVPVPAWIAQSLRELRAEIEIKSGLSRRCQTCSAMQTSS